MKIAFHYRKSGEYLQEVWDFDSVPRVGETVVLDGLKSIEPSGRLVEKVIWYGGRRSPVRVKIILS